MKNIIFFIIFLFLLSACGNDSIITYKKKSVLCPKILVSSKHDIYIKSSESIIDIDSIEYKAEINNFLFQKGCFLSPTTSELNILFIINPIDTKNENIKLPFYLAIIDSKDEVVEIQYYLTEGLFSINSETKKLEETELIKKVDLNFPSDLANNKIIIGFMLDKNKKELLN